MLSSCFLSIVWNENVYFDLQKFWGLAKHISDFVTWQQVEVRDDTFFTSVFVPSWSTLMKLVQDNLWKLCRNLFIATLPIFVMTSCSYMARKTVCARAGTLFWLVQKTWLIGFAILAALCIKHFIIDCDLKGGKIQWLNEKEKT